MPGNGVQEETPPILIFVSSLPLRMAVSLPPCFPVVSHLALLLHVGNHPILFFGCLGGEDHVSGFSTPPCHCHGNEVQGMRSH